MKPRIIAPAQEPTLSISTPSPSESPRIDSLTMEAIAGSAHPHYLLQDLLRGNGLNELNRQVSARAATSQKTLTVEEIRMVIDEVMAARFGAMAATDAADPVAGGEVDDEYRAQQRSMFAPEVEGLQDGFPAPKMRSNPATLTRVYWEPTESVLDMDAVHAVVFLVRTQLLLEDWKARRIDTVDAAERITAAVAERNDRERAGDGYSSGTQSPAAS